MGEDNWGDYGNCWRSDGGRVVGGPFDNGARHHASNSGAEDGVAGGFGESTFLGAGRRASGNRTYPWDEHENWAGTVHAVLARQRTARRIAARNSLGKCAELS